MPSNLILIELIIIVSPSTTFANPFIETSDFSKGL